MSRRGRFEWVAAILILSLSLTACKVLPNSTATGGAAPYPPSRLITAVHWDFSHVERQRRAHGSDMWPCTWAADDQLYCAWGDGGGFDGDDDNIGRVSLGFARISGSPSANDPGAFSGKNIWGDAAGYAEHPATFGGKVGSLLAVEGKLFTYGSLWTSDTVPDPVHRGGPGPVNRLIWSDDGGASWQIAPWENHLFGSFLNFGADAAPDGYAYIYYKRAGDDTRVYLARVPPEDLTSDPATSQSYEYLTGVGRGGRERAWSKRETDANAIFIDPRGAEVEVVYDAPLHRYLLVSGHDLATPAAGKVGLFDAPHPWGPWTTVGYYADLGALGPHASGDYLGMAFPTKWMSDDGRSLWGVFSSLHEYDSFNLVGVTFELARRPKWR